MRVNIDKEKSLGEKYGIKMLPSLMIFSKKNKTGTPYELPDAEYFLEMADKIIEVLKAPEPTESMEKDALALLQRIQDGQRDGQAQAAIAELKKAATGLNITQTWKTKIAPLMQSLFEEDATRLKESAISMAEEGKCKDALQVLDRIKKMYSDTPTANSEAIQNIDHNCRSSMEAQSR